ncbi:hypothetical protein HanRHA438_Chr07g0304041 [Helianthus annuus]|uniref:Uncharacterized protein n=1 Tax=Helianthus annuus TaxID=4232 RepID=A0A251TZ17_HELAN|nr:hypothetical protein HanXRQr2_Chr07g0293691 [Helianthus annuus]KAJ0550090.1 hypothetical protein HanHA300_Chr07g0241451 [Helianthus annuus]KAJ0556698.1 hypothetical protein HanIR_Chr07g0316771 [Helianthus annuus]KAJ0563043.1 hypothetical protein HanHA89_Chr07g0258611 [Helianthus annuus]KAJ0728413.1 hypothetical protein HanLR1_Chr07g0241311 [Helianthus annuus]
MTQQLVCRLRGPRGAQKPFCSLSRGATKGRSDPINRWDRPSVANRSEYQSLSRIL